MKKNKTFGDMIAALLGKAIGLFAASKENPIERALLLKEIENTLPMRTQAVGILYDSQDLDKATEKMVYRAEKNINLRAAFRMAKDAGINIYVSAINPFSVVEVDGGHITINPWYSDEKIIAALTRE